MGARRTSSYAWSDAHAGRRKADGDAVELEDEHGRLLRGLSGAQGGLLRFRRQRHADAPQGAGLLHRLDRRTIRGRHAGRREGLPEREWAHSRRHCGTRDAGQAVFHGRGREDNYHFRHVERLFAAQRRLLRHGGAQAAGAADGARLLRGRCRRRVRLFHGKRGQVLSARKRTVRGRPGGRGDAEEAVQLLGQVQQPPRDYRRPDSDALALRRNGGQRRIQRAGTSYHAGLPVGRGGRWRR